MIALPTPLPSSAWWVTTCLGNPSESKPTSRSQRWHLLPLLAEDVYEAFVDALGEGRVFLRALVRVQVLEVGYSQLTLYKLPSEPTPMISPSLSSSR